MVAFLQAENNVYTPPLLLDKFGKSGKLKSKQF